MLFSYRHFQMYQQLIYNKIGIYLSDMKKDTLHNKVDKVMKKFSVESYEKFYRLLTHEEKYLAELVNEITINKTEFFREINHFNFIQNNIDFIIKNNPKILTTNEIRVWSTACSTGEEAYTLAIILKECLGNSIRIKILATDISQKVLLIAQKGLYPCEMKESITEKYLHKYFEKSENKLQVKEDIQSLITFRLFNLMADFPFQGTFDIIFCRNVMIYFDTVVQQQLLYKLTTAITRGGLLFIGYSESLINKKHHLEYIQPTIYIKKYA